ncbi:DUF6157 family protein [Brevibacillus sp. SYSU BS000544]|uniref:DUF6157 family protein n=1 Tax=Brevibacillus sp. SYSU BS000544 TaxID=3416443 RepID=UPI003CE4B601
MSYLDTFIQVAPDCPVTSSVIPAARNEKKPMHVIQYELLAQHPYEYTHEDLLFEVHIRRKEFSREDLANRGEEIRAELFQKKHPCLRASSLPKKYGWGVHYNSEGKIALYGMETDEYKKFVEGVQDGNTQLLYALKSKRG